MTKIHTLKVGITNCFVLEGEKGFVLVDTGAPHNEKKFIDFFSSCGLSPRDLKLILITHAHHEHLGSAVALKRLTGAPIALHPADESLSLSGVRWYPPAQNLRSELLRLFFLLTRAWYRFEPFSTVAN